MRSGWKMEKLKGKIFSTFQKISKRSRWKSVFQLRQHRPQASSLSRKGLLSGAVCPENSAQGGQSPHGPRASDKSGSIQSEQTWGVCLGAQDCLDMAWPCPSMRDSPVGPDGPAWQWAGPHVGARTGRMTKC